jgi:hypothetical protein
MENTATSNYWHEHKPICSECDPAIGKWHGRFPKESASGKGLIVASDGFLYDTTEKDLLLKRGLSILRIIE